jgi:Fe-S-cluster-containing dehydrogenase component
MSKWNMIVDVAKCENCRNCFLAAKDEHIGNDFPGYAASQPLHGHNWIDIRVKERGAYPIVDAHAMPVMCNHCDDAPCIRAANAGAVYKRPDGIVIIDPVKAKGQQQIVGSCPYGAIYWNEELKLPQIWIFDAHLLDNGWKQTRAEQACPTGALKSLKVSDEEMKRIAASENLEVLSPGKGSKPRVYYKNLHLMTHCFIGGTVVTNPIGCEECLEGAQVRLSKDGNVVAETVSDTFGEFKIDCLKENSGEYELTVRAVGKNNVESRKVVLGESQYVGVIALS